MVKIEATGIAKTTLILILMALPIVGGTISRRDYEPSTTDSPKLNKDSQRSLILHVTIPPTLKIIVSAQYMAGSRSTKCQRTYNWFEGISVAYAVWDPLDMRDNGDEKVATVAVDRYLPGRCQWGLAYIWYEIASERPVDKKLAKQLKHAPMDLDHSGIIATTAKAQRADCSPKCGELYQGRLDLWCRRPLVERHYTTMAVRTQCRLWQDHLWDDLLGGSSAAEAHSLPGYKQPRTYIFPTTESVDVHFHDLDVTDPSP